MGPERACRIERGSGERRRRYRPTRSWSVCVVLGLVAALTGGCGGGSTTSSTTRAARDATHVGRSAHPATVTRALQQALDDGFREAGVPGVSAAVVLPDGTLWMGVDGRAEIEPARSVTPRTLFAAGSGTKTYVAALVLK